MLTTSDRKMSNNWRMVYEFLLLSEELLEFYRMNNFLTEYSEFIDERYEMNPFYVLFQRNLLQLNPILNVNRNGCLFVKDYISDMEFLDTGACRSFYPRYLVPERIIPKRNHNNNFLAANSTLIGTYGTTKVRLDFGVGRVFNWNFTIADTAELIIGADFLDYYDILVDIRNRRILLNNEENE
ncbi:GSCOCG00001742001-RA-CDS [Cotesia congregata]|nr:GSCOCG00001742001-RA-CDS [Cotesia congregata]